MLVYLYWTSFKIFQPTRPRFANYTNENITYNNNVVFVLGNLVSQGKLSSLPHVPTLISVKWFMIEFHKIYAGQHFRYKRLMVRFAVGAWCLGCFFIVQMYSTTLTSHLMAPNQKPIANNLNEIVNTPGLGLTMDFGFGFHQELPVYHQIILIRELNFNRTN